MILHEVMRNFYVCWIICFNYEEFISLEYPQCNNELQKKLCYIQYTKVDILIKSKKKIEINVEFLDYAVILA